jgi:hypothetical protein
MPVSIQDARKQKAEDPALIVHTNKNLRLRFRTACVSQGTTMRDVITRYMKYYVRQARKLARKK